MPVHPTTRLVSGAKGRPAAGVKKRPINVKRVLSALNLRYVAEDEPGFRRLRRGRGFVYYTPQGTVLRDKRHLARIRSLAIPPAWKNVWICRDARGHIQATGRDGKGRKQYRYHVRWRQIRDTDKFQHLLEFGRVLPEIRRQAKRDLALPGLPRQKVLAAAILLMDRCLIRVGNAEYTRQNGSYGLTTLQTSHVKVVWEPASRVRIRFRGKGGIQHDVQFEDRRLARVIGACHELRGQRLFQYCDENGQLHAVESGDINDYLRTISGIEVTSKFFRTWAATTAAASFLCTMGPAETKRATQQNVNAAIKHAAARLRNTPAVCRRSYIHPVILAHYEAGELCTRADALRAALTSLTDDELDSDETLVLAYLRALT